MAKRKKSKNQAPTKQAEQVSATEASTPAQDSQALEQAPAEAPEEALAGAPVAVESDGSSESSASESQREADASVWAEPGETPADPAAEPASEDTTHETIEAGVEATSGEDNEPAQASDEFDQVWSQAGASAADETATESSEAAPIENAENTDPSAEATGEENGEEGGEEKLPENARLSSIIESLLFASDKALGLSDLKRLLGERDGKKITAAVQTLIEERKGSGIEIVALSSGWHLRTNPEFANWVSKLLVGKPVRLSRAMMETLAIVAYRQPVTRPEVDDIRGVDCGPVLKTLLDRGLVRIIGKKEEVGRPMLYGTTPEFLRVFNLPDLSELPTLREFYDLSAENQSRVEAEHGSTPETTAPSATTPKPDVALKSVARGALSPEDEDTDPLLDELDEASIIAKKALGDLEPPTEGEEKAEGGADQNPGNTSEIKSETQSDDRVRSGKAPATDASSPSDESPAPAAE